jgi:hypothetical protein
LTDEVRLTIPAEEDFRRVAHLVLGGLAVRLDLTFEVLEDLQLAVDSLLERRDDERDVTLAVVLEPGELRTSIGPFEGRLVSDLAREEDGFGLRQVLATVCDRFELVDREGDQWVELRKRVEEH